MWCVEVVCMVCGGCVYGVWRLCVVCVEVVCVVCGGCVWMYEVDVRRLCVV